jgi:hypothetical protein
VDDGIGMGMDAPEVPEAFAGVKVWPIMGPVS